MTTAERCGPMKLSWSGLAATLTGALGVLAVPVAAAAVLMLPVQEDLALALFVFALIFEARIVLAVIGVARMPQTAPAALFSAVFEFVLLSLLALTWLGLAP